MKQRCFIKFDPKIKRLTGCDRATLILEKIEFFFSKYPDGFYKFIEPCSHRLYKKDDSWAEELGCDRKCFTRSWDKIGFRHKSRRAFEAAEDKFGGKLYASYYDRHLNQMFFVRNHDLANETLKEFFKPKKQKGETVDCQDKKVTDSVTFEPLGTGHSVRSYIETNNTTNDLSKDKSHASNEIVKKMVEIWTTIVEDGKTQFELTNRRVAFLKQAFIDKFGSCLEKWKKYCERITSSRFLMGEIKSSFKATLDWALEFETIQKILEGCNYGIGDRVPPSPVPDTHQLVTQISSLDESECLKEFRIRCLRQLGGNTYISWFKNLFLSFDGDTLSLTAHNGFTADYLGRTFYTSLRVLMEGSGQGISSLLVCVQGEPKERLRIERDRENLVSGTDFLPLEPEAIHDQETPLGKGAQPEEGGNPEDNIGRDEEGIENFPEFSCFEVPEEPGEEEIMSESYMMATHDGDGVTDTPETSDSLTASLLACLSKVSSQQLPSWLLKLKAFRQGRGVVVVFDDPLTADYARSFHAERIFIAIRQLWPSIQSVSIQSC